MSDETPREAALRILKRVEQEKYLSSDFMKLADVYARLAQADAIREAGQR